MKKSLFVFIACLFPLVLSAQSIKNSGINPFTGDSIIVTSWSRIDTKAILPLEENFDFSFMLRKEDNKLYFHLKRNNAKINKINRDSKIQFMLIDNSLITLHAIDTFIAETDVYTYLDMSRSRNIIHAVYEGDFSSLLNGSFIKAIQIETMWGKLILKLDKKNAEKINKAYQLILQN